MVSFGRGNWFWFRKRGEKYLAGYKRRWRNRLLGRDAVVVTTTQQRHTVRLFGRDLMRIHHCFVFVFLIYAHF